MRNIKTSTGVTVLLDGDLLAIMEVLYHEVTARHELARSFDDMNREITNLIGQMTAPELRKYLQEALFVNTITYENQRAAAYMRRVGGRRKKGVLHDRTQQRTGTETRRVGGDGVEERRERMRAIAADLAQSTCRRLEAEPRTLRALRMEEG